MSSNDAFVWSGPASGSWGAASDWTDTTTSSPATTPPGPSNQVTINSRGQDVLQTITGAGGSAELIINGDTSLAGTFSTGALTLANSASLTLGSGDSLSVTGDATVQYGDIMVSGGSFTVAGTFDSGNGVNVQSAGKVQVAALNQAAVLVDATSSFEVGTAGGAKAGAFTVDSGVTVTSVRATAPTVTNAGTITGGQIEASQVNNTGSITGVQFHGYGENETFSITNSGTITLVADWLPGPLVDNGVVIADPSNGGLNNLVSNVTGIGQLQIADGGNLTANDVGAGITVAFLGSTGILNLSPNSSGGDTLFPFQITGFSRDDVIGYDGTATSAVYHASSGILSLLNGSTEVAELHLTGNYSGDTFSVDTQGGSTSIALNGGSNTSTPPAGTTTVDNYNWIGPAVGSWDAAANWADPTRSQSPAAVPPGANDDVTITANVSGSQIITGTGNSAELTIKGATMLAGAFATGSLQASATLTVQSNASLAVSGSASGGNIFVSGGAFSVAGPLSGSILNLQDGGKVQAGALDAVNLYVDSSSTFVVGGAGGAKAGVFAVDAGATVTLGAITAPTVTNAGTITGASIEAAQVNNTGTITGTQFRGLGDDENFQLTNSGTISLSDDWLPGPVVNNGVLYAGPGTNGLYDNIGPVTGTGQIQIAAGAELFTATVDSGNTVVFDGSSGQLDITSDSLDSAKTYDAKISGFQGGDAIEYAGKVTTATYNASNGVLVLANGSTVVAKLHLAGAYAGTTFSAIALNGASLITVGGGDTSTPPAGTSTPDQYAWSGPTTGSWDAAANWTDVSTSSHPALVAPGIHDSVTIGASGVFQVITGTGNSAALTVDGPTTLAGKFSTGSLTIPAAEAPGQGNSLTLGSQASLTVSGNASAFSALDAVGGSIKIGGTLTGQVSASNGGTVQAGALANGGVTVDATSSVEVGTKGGAKAGALTVDAGAQATLDGLTSNAVVNHGTITNGGADPIAYTTTVTNTGSISGVTFHAIGETGTMSFNNSGTITLTGDWLPGSIVDTGVVIAGPSTTGLNNLVGAVTGTGQLQIANGGALGTSTVAAGITLAFEGSSGSLSISSASLDSSKVYDAKITGFSAGDVIDYAGAVTSVSYSAANQMLTLRNGSALVAKLHVAGNYSGDTFLVSSNDGAAQITVDPPAPAAHFVFHFPGGAGGQTEAPALVSDVVSGGGSDGASGGLTASDAGSATVAPLAELSTHAFTDTQLLHAPQHAAAADFVL